MKVELMEATPNPEEVVCRAARNDYRSNGVVDKPLHEVMENASLDEEIHDEVVHEDYGEDTPDHVWEYPDVVAKAKRRTLLSHLMDHGHWGPFEHPQATIAIEGVTRVLMAQITRHRHFTFDIMSLRYVGLDDLEPEDEDEDFSERFQFPEFRGPDFDVDREGVHQIDDPQFVEEIYDEAYRNVAQAYLGLLAQGVPQEQARKVLPMGTKVNIVMSANARAWMHILNVRTKSNVQGETRRCSEAIFQELKEWMPYTFEKYDEDILPLRLNP